MLIMIHGAVLLNNQPGINQYAERRGCNTYRIAGLVGTVRMVTSRADREASRAVRDGRGELDAALRGHVVFRMVTCCFENKSRNAICRLLKIWVQMLPNMLGIMNDMLLQLRSAATAQFSFHL